MLLGQVPDFNGPGERLMDECVSFQPQAPLMGVVFFSSGSHGRLMAPLAAPHGPRADVRLTASTVHSEDLLEVRP